LDAAQNARMPSHSNARSTPVPDRADIATDLYLQGGARDASDRCDTNDRLGGWDLFAELARVLRIERHHTVADVCAGSGQHVVKFARLAARAVGYDFSEAAVEQARQRGAEAYVADGASLPLPDASVDALSCAFGVYYLPDLNAAIREWTRVLKPGGRIAISGPAHGTNAELYAFHQQATGEGPSDADTMALGYIDDVVGPALEAAPFSDVVVQAFVNRIEFPDATAFLDYWRSTSLFLRTTHPDIENGARLLTGHHEPLRVTKRVSIASATRAK
jgi:ubiquinone/menaquinone biosynthesis C-methylase UbiE